MRNFFSVLASLLHLFIFVKAKDHGSTVCSQNIDVDSYLLKSTTPKQTKLGMLVLSIQELQDDVFTSSGTPTRMVICQIIITQACMNIWYGRSIKKL